MMLRRTWVAVLAFALVGHAFAAGRTRHVEPTPIDAAAFEQLVGALKSESFAGGKLDYLRAIHGLYLFNGAQATEVLGTFDFWNDRLDGLRLILPANSATVGAILRYFEAAPDLYKSEARRILRL